MRRLAVALTLTALLGGADAALAAPPNNFVGIVAEDVFAGNAQYREQVLTRHKRLGIQVIRQTFDWSLIERQPGRYDFGSYDAYVAHAAHHGIRIVPVLFKPPAFHSRGAHDGGFTYPPKRFATMGAFGAAVAKRYGPQGSLWREQPALRKLPVTSYQVWNEPNLPIYWPKTPSAKQYAKLLVAVSRGIKTVDRRAEIITGGMPESKYPGAVPLLKYVKQLYRSGGGAGFDTLAINTYAQNSKDLIKLLTGVRKTMNGAGDKRARIWASEFGWATQGPKSRFTVSPGVQARNVANSITAMGKNRKRLRLSGFVYWNWKDAPPYRAGFDFWGLHAGLLSQDGRPKPGLQAFADAVRKLK